MFGKKKNNENKFSEALKKDGEGNNQEQSLKNINIKRYKDLEGITLKKLNVGLWYIEHRLLLKNIFIGFMIALSAITWSYSIYGFSYYLAKGMRDDQLMVNEIVKQNVIGHEYLLNIGPVDLTVGKVEALKSSGGRYDFVVQINNPNKRYGAEFEYYFVVGEEKTNVYKNFILPGQSKYLLSLSNEYDSAPTSAGFMFGNFYWRKVNIHKIPDWDKYVSDRLKIITKDISFVPASISGLSKEAGLNTLEFTAINESAYNYWDVDFVILLQSVGGTVSVNKYNINEFMSNEASFVSMSWPGTVGRVNKVDIIPEINIFDENIYIEPKGGVGETK